MLDEGWLPTTFGPPPSAHPRPSTAPRSARLPGLPPDAPTPVHPSLESGCILAAFEIGLPHAPARFRHPSFRYPYLTSSVLVRISQAQAQTNCQSEYIRPLSAFLATAFSLLSKSAYCPPRHFPAPIIALPIANFLNSRANQSSIGLKEQPKRVHPPSPSAFQSAAFSLLWSTARHRPPTTLIIRLPISNSISPRVNQPSIGSKESPNVNLGFQTGGT